MQMSENINELATALAKAQGEMKNAGKTSDNPFFKSKYADLAEILNAVREPLSKYGLSISQLYDGMGVPDKTITVTTLLMHSSGQYIGNTANYPVAKADIQGVGSAITYARRYSLAAILGLSQEDDDGNAACRPEAPQPEQQRQQGDRFVHIASDGTVSVVLKGGVYKKIQDVEPELLAKMAGLEQYRLAHPAIKELLESTDAQG